MIYIGRLDMCIACIGALLGNDSKKKSETNVAHLQSSLQVSWLCPNIATKTHWPSFAVVFW